MWDEFKKFIAAGNVIDLAVGVLIGGMFGKIVTAFVEDLINPVLGLMGKADFTNLYISLSDKVKPGPDGNLPALADAKKLGPVLAYGDFITVAINTLILAFIIFLVVKGINRMREMAKKDAATSPEEPAAPAPDVLLLTEIRDLLKTK